MADVFLVTIELEKQGEGCQLNFGVLDEDTLGIQLFLQHFRPKALRDHGKLQIAVITHVVIDDIVGHTVCIEVLRLTIGIQRNGYGTGHRSRCSVRHCSVLCNRQKGVVCIFKVEFDLIVLIRHS